MLHATEIVKLFMENITVGMEKNKLTIIIN